MSRDSMLFGVGLVFGAAVGVITAPWVYAPNHVADASKMVEASPPQPDPLFANSEWQSGEPFTPTSTVESPTGRVR